MKILVIPSIRKECLENFLIAWRDKGDWDKIIVIEDNPEKTFALRDIDHYCWQDIEKYKNHFIFSRRDSAIRCFGFYLAYKEGAEYSLTLDDDCYPIDYPIFQKHIDIINGYTKWTNSCGIRSRGIPYNNLGKLDSVIANMGLWTNNADFDAIGMFTNENNYFQPPKGNKLIPNGQYFPLCGMHFCFKTKYTPLFYFPLMGEGYPYRRFDDIWSGIVAKKVIDHLKLHISVGKPFVEHKKTSNKFTNLIKEAPGIEANEYFWELIDNIKLSSSNMLDCLLEISDNLQTNKDCYFNKLGVALESWTTLFKSH